MKMEAYNLLGNLLQALLFLDKTKMFKCLYVQQFDMQDKLNFSKRLFLVHLKICRSVRRSVVLSSLTLISLIII
jgi:hypothetical protein